MKFGYFSFGSVEIEDATYEHGVIIDRGEVLKRKKKPWDAFRTCLHMPRQWKSTYLGSSGS